MIKREKQTKSEILYGEREIASGSLICFPNPNNDRDYEISIDFPEFTCKCPFSGYPDFANLRIIYQPNTKVIELKAIKLYFNSFREKKVSHEEVTNKIIDDLVEVSDPKWMQLEADFNPRGNIHTIIRVCHGKRNNLELID
nr:preQ(1) synthase [Prochlorococcus marinus]